MYKVGDTIEITQEMVNALKKVNSRWKGDDWDAWLGMRGTCCAKRLSRDRGHMTVYWGNGEETNVYWLEGIGLEFNHPDFPEIPIAECPEELLTGREAIIKTLMEWGDSEAVATAKVDEIVGAMNKNELVFYRP